MAELSKFPTTAPAASRRKGAVGGGPVTGVAPDPRGSGDVSHAVRLVVREIAEDLVEKDRLYRNLFVDKAVSEISEAIVATREILKRERPVKSTSQLWFAAMGDLPRPRRGSNAADLEYLGVQHLLPKIPNLVQRAFLLSWHEPLYPGLKETTRAVLRDAATRWVRLAATRACVGLAGGGAAASALAALGLDIRRSRGDSVSEAYPVAYISPREEQLHLVANDSKRTQAERLDAAAQLSRIEEKRYQDSSKHEPPTAPAGLFRPGLAGRRTRGAPYKFNPSKPCDRHGTRGCSKCHPRYERADPETRFIELSNEAGLDGAWLKAPFTRGRLTDSQRFDQETRKGSLLTVIQQMHAERFTLKAIGTATGRTAGQISDLLRAYPGRA